MSETFSALLLPLPTATGRGCSRCDGGAPVGAPPACGPPCCAFRCEHPQPRATHTPLDLHTTPTPHHHGKNPRSRLGTTPQNDLPICGPSPRMQSNAACTLAWSVGLLLVCWLSLLNQTDLPHSSKGPTACDSNCPIPIPPAVTESPGLLRAINGPTGSPARRRRVSRMFGGLGVFRDPVSVRSSLPAPSFDARSRPVRLPASL